MQSMSATEAANRKPAPRRRGLRKSWPEKLFDAFNYTLFAALGLSTLLPFVNLLAKSLSSEEAVVSGIVGLVPVGWQLGTYRFVLADAAFLGALRVSVTLTVLGTAASLLLTTLTAYPLSKPRLAGRKWLLLLFIFTMLFNGGLIPTYLLLHNLHLVNKLAVLFLPSMVNVFNLLVIKNYFEGLPDSLEESAKLDGAGHARILYSVYLPLSLPVLATIALFFAVSYWNDYFNAMIYISDPSLKPLQLFLKELLVSSGDFLRNATMDPDQALNTAPQSIQAASIMLATIPILIVYPFLQKYFVKGVLVGSVKE